MRCLVAPSVSYWKGTDACVLISCSDFLLCSYVTGTIFLLDDSDCFVDVSKGIRRHV